MSDTHLKTTGRSAEPSSSPPTPSYSSDTGNHTRAFTILLLKFIVSPAPWWGRLGSQRERWPRCRTWRPATCCSGASSSVPRPTARRGRTRGPSSRRPPQPSPCRWPPADTGRGHAQDVVHDVTFLMSEILNSIFFEIKSICNILHLNLT